MGISNLWMWGENSIPKPNQMEDTLEHLLGWQEHSILAPRGSLSLQARTRQLPHGQGDPSAVAASQSMTVCQILYPSASTEKDRQSVTNVLFLLCSSCRKLGFFPLFSSLFQNFSFGVNAAYCPTCFLRRYSPQPCFGLSESQGNQVDSIYFCGFPFLAFQNSFHCQQL